MRWARQVAGPHRSDWLDDRCDRLGI
jgi:hypothetical protein